jgi:hypothetical protein
MPAFRRFADPFVITATATSAATQVPIAGDPKFPTVGQGRSFRILNKSPYFIRLRGSKGTFVPVSASTGWCFLPYSVEVYASQLPDWVSVVIEPMPGETLPAGASGVLEMSYGTGE